MRNNSYYTPAQQRGGGGGGGGYTGFTLSVRLSVDDMVSGA